MPAVFVLVNVYAWLTGRFPDDGNEAILEPLSGCYANLNLPTQCWESSSRAANQFFFGNQFLLETDETAKCLRLAQRIRIKYGIVSVGDTTLIYDPATDTLEVTTPFTYKDRKCELMRVQVSGRGWEVGSNLTQ